jgi:hypothetical protein
VEITGRILRRRLRAAVQRARKGHVRGTRMLKNPLALALVLALAARPAPA